MTETPEAVAICSKEQGQTTLERLNAEDLCDWLTEYRLGQLWSNAYVKGKHSFEVLALRDPSALSALPSFARALRILQEKL